MDYYDYTDYDAVAGIFGGLAVFIIIVGLIALAISVVQIIGLWKVFKKAGKGGWEAIIPFYCNWVLVEIAGLNWWWFLFFFAPTVSAWVNLEWLGWIAYLFGVFNCYYNIAKKFNKDIGFAICLTLFTPICIPILGFSKDCLYNSNVKVSKNGCIKDNEESINSTVVYQNNIQSNDTNENVQNNNNVEQNEMFSFCGNCGTKMNKDTRFCPNCGKERV